MRLTMVHRLRLALASRWMPLAAAGLAVLLTLPSLRAGLVLDDFFHKTVATQRHPLPDSHRSPIDLFRFLQADPARAQQLIDFGLVPWWTWPQIRAGFWRPVTGATHWLDYQLWPQSPWLMHAQNLAWYALLAAVVGLLYRRTMGATWVAGLAAVLYAIDDAHGMPVGWVANRNAVIAACFAVLAIIAHDHRRRRGGWVSALSAPVLLVVSLLAAEAGLAACAYLFAYALFLDKHGWRRGLLSLAPYAAVVVAWRIAWMVRGYGVDGLGLYTDPLGQPGQYLAGLTWKVPILLLGQWAGPPADLATLVPGDRLAPLVGLAVVVVVGLGLLLAPLIRREPIARFWACGMLLSLLPIAATFPSDRLLFFVGIGAMGLLALFFQKVVESPTLSRWRLVPTGVLVLIHLVLAPLLMPLRSAFPAGPPTAVRAMSFRVPLDESVRAQTVVVVNAPIAAIVHYLPVIRLLEDEPVPRRTRVLAPAVPSVTVRRANERSLLVSQERGYLVVPFDQLFRTLEHPLGVGDRVELAGMTAEIQSVTPDNRPLAVLFRFDVPLEDESLRWFCYQDGEYVPFALPPIGETVVLRADWPW